MTRDDRELIREAVCALGMAGLAIGLLLGLAARLVSHATKGERYPHMTDGHYGPRQW